MVTSSSDESVIGMYGDRVGRKPAMVLSFALMGASILDLALTPSYAKIEDRVTVGPTSPAS